MAASTPGTGPDSPQAAWSPRLALLVAGTFFMEFLDGTILTTAIPSIASDFAVPAADVNVTMTAYLLTVAVGIPLSGWLAERFGARRIFCMAIAVFTLASLACALGPDLTGLTLARIAQGLGGAMMVPVGTLVVLRGTPKSELLRATAFLVWPGLLAPVIAPLVGGALTTYLSWHWIFLINLPLGLAAFVAALRLVPSIAGDSMRRLDWPGLFLTALGVGALVAGLELAGSHPDLPWTGLISATGLAALTAAVIWMRRTRHPLFNLKVFRTRTFRATATGGFIYRLTISSVPFLLPLMFQTGFGWSPLHAGAMVAAVFVGNIGIKPATTPLIRRLGFRSVLAAASLMSAITFFLCALLTPQTPQVLILGLLVCSGAFRSIGFSAYASVQYADVAPGHLTSANGVSATLVQLATGAGIAVAALLVRAFDGVVPGQAAGPPFAGLLGDPAAPFRWTLVAMAVLMLASTVDSLLLPRDAGAEVSRAGRSVSAPSKPRDAAARPTGPADKPRDAAGVPGDAPGGAAGTSPTSIAALDANPELSAELGGSAKVSRPGQARVAEPPPHLPAAGPSPRR